MDVNLLAPTVIRKLLTGEQEHSELSSATINCCTIGDVFFEVEKLKKQGHQMTQILSSSTEFHRALASNAATLAPLDSQALQSSLFEDGEDGLQFFRQAVDAAHPSESINVIALRDFDLVWGTDLLPRCLQN